MSCSADEWRGSLIKARIAQEHAVDATHPSHARNHLHGLLKAHQADAGRRIETPVPPGPTEQDRTNRGTRIVLLRGGCSRHSCPNHGSFYPLPWTGSKPSGLSAVLPLLDCMSTACMHTAEVSCPHRKERIGSVCKRAGPSSHFECYVGGQDCREGSSKWLPCLNIRD